METTIGVKIGSFNGSSENYIVDNYFQNWSFYVDINGVLLSGTITSSTANVISESDYPITESYSVIIVDWAFAIPTGAQARSCIFTHK